MMHNLEYGHRREIMRAEIKTRIFSLNCVFIFILCLSCFGQEVNIFKQRRQKLADRIENGIVIIQSSERNQNNLYEFFVPNSDNHDFIYLTGLETPGSTLILCPASLEYPETCTLQKI